MHSMLTVYSTLLRINTFKKESTVTHVFPNHSFQKKHKPKPSAVGVVVAVAFVVILTFTTRSTRQSTTCDTDTFVRLSLKFWGTGLALIMGLFGKTPERNPKDMVNEWCQKIRKESNQLDRQIRAIQREEEKIKRSLKEAAKKGDKDVCNILAKEIIRARKAINKIHTSKAHLNSIQLQMKNQQATLRVAGSLQKSTEVMNAMQRLISVPEVAATMREMSREMMRAGIIEEMLEETMDSMDDQEELEEEAQEEVDKVLWELTAGQIGKAPAAVTDALGPSPAVASTSAEDEEDLEEMQSRLQALRS